MDWSSLNFKGKDVIVFIVYVVSAVYFVGRIQSSIERQGDKMDILTSQFTELKSEAKSNSKEGQITYQNLQNQVNANTQQILLLKQEVQGLSKN